MEKIASAYSWGKNKDGELSIGSTRDTFHPEAIRGMKNKQIVSVSSGGQHSACIDSAGTIYVCGSYLHGKLGIEDLSTISILSFKPIKSLQTKKIKQVSCGDYHTLCLTDDGQVYTWGGNLHKKLGQRSSSGKGSSKPGLVTQLKEKNIIYVDCGDFHSIALGSDGKLYSWGGGGSHFNKGQCGLGHTNDTDEPTIIKSLRSKEIVKVSCGGYHTLALTSQNELYAWGGGLHGELGSGDFLNSASPQLVLFPWVKKDGEDIKEILNISGGGHHSLVLTANGEVFSFGFASHGQLGLGNVINYCEPQPISYLKHKKVSEIVAGWNHSLILTEEGDVWSCGYGFYGQLGLGDDEPRTVFTHINALGNKKICKIFAGGNHSWALLDLNDPIRENYSPPSPLLESEDEKREILLSFTAQAPKSEYELTIVYSDSVFCHRFIYFILKEASLDIGKARVDEYVSEMYYIENGFQTHFISSEDKLVEGAGEIVYPENKCAFSCVMVCDTSRNIPPVVCEGKKEERTVKKKSYELEANTVETALSEWIRYFMVKVGNFCKQTPIFLELRPSGF